MSSTSVSDQEKSNGKTTVDPVQLQYFESENGEITESSPQPFTVQRKLNPRSLQIISIGGAIATSLFITISSGLLYGGPLSLFLAFFIWSLVVYCLVVAMGEMVCYLPIEAPFIQIAGRCIDRSFAFSVGIVYWLTTSIFIPFEITAVNGMIHFWRDDYSPAITFCLEIFIYMVLNLLAVKYFGESEFYLSLGKFLLGVGLIIFTFVVMVGGNPQHDAFGFRYWKNPGPMVETFATGNLGRFHGFMVALNKAIMVIVGPEYIAMLAGETGGETRRVLSKTFKTVILRLLIFYVFGALCVGILVPSNDPTLISLASSGSTSSGAYSPYVIAMQNMKIKILPHIVNALCVSSAFSAGNSYVYCSSRALYGLAERGLAPKIFRTCTKNGIPIYCVGMAFLFSCLSLLQLSDNTASVLSWMINVISGCQVLNYFLMICVYIGFYHCVEAQGLDKSTFRYRAWFQPWLSYFAASMFLLMVGAIGYTVFLPGFWSIQDFLTYYLMVFIALISYIGHKLIYRTSFIKPSEADLYSGLDEIEEHEMRYLEELEKSGYERKWYDKVLDALFS